LLAMMVVALASWAVLNFLLDEPLDFFPGLGDPILGALAALEQALAL
jgi:hypothetical protein